MQPIATERGLSALGLSVCSLLVSFASPAKTAEPIEMPFGRMTRVDEGNHVLDGGPDLTTERGNFVQLKSIGSLCYGVRSKMDNSRYNLSTLRLMLMLQVVRL